MPLFTAPQRQASGMKTAPFGSTDTLDLHNHLEGPPL